MGRDVDLSRERILKAHAEFSGGSKMASDPWRVAVVAILDVDDFVSETILVHLFRVHSTPESIASADRWELASILRADVLGVRSVKNVLDFTHAWVYGLRRGTELIPWTDLRDLPGVTARVAECVGKLCFGETDEPSR